MKQPAQLGSAQQLAETSGSTAVDGDARLRLGHGWTLQLDTQADGARLSITHAQHAPVNVEIVLTADGPVIRAAAAALELNAAHAITARCEQFAIEARQSVTIQAREIVQQARAGLRAEAEHVTFVANAGNIQLRANDDVQLLGEQVLLNCDRPEPVPDWVHTASSLASSPPQASWGDRELLAALERD